MLMSGFFMGKFDKTNPVCHRDANKASLGRPEAGKAQSSLLTSQEENKMIAQRIVSK